MGMKAIVEDPHGWLTAGCVISLIAIILINFALLIFSSVGFSIDNISLWKSSFASELTFITGFLMGGNLKSH